MEFRKKREIAYYDERAREWQKKYPDTREQSVDIEDYNIFLFSSYQYCYHWLEKNIKPGMKLLDYGCGHGMHSILPVKLGAEVYAIDLSEESLKIAEKRAGDEGLTAKIKFIKMDCESLEFPDNYFDIIWDGGTFSSLDIEIVFPELSRVLKTGGKLIGIETFGHNLFANFKRWINKKVGKRTSWAAGHIIKIRDLKLAEQYFDQVEIKYFHLLSMFAFPLRKLPGGKLLFKILDYFDTFLLKFTFLKKYAFKLVFIFSKLHHHD